MKKLFYLFFIFLFIPNCTLNKVINYHGVHFLEKKYKSVAIKKTNKNDVIQLLGPPSTKSEFNDNLWIYIERNTSSSKLSKLGKKDLLTNNIVLLEFNTQGLLVDKILITKNDMKNIEFSKKITGLSTGKQSTIYNLLTSMREKINDPLGKKRKRIER